MVDSVPAPDRLPLWQSHTGDRPIAWHDDRIIALSEFTRHVSSLAQRLTVGDAMVNLCDDRYHFLVAYAAAQSLGHTVLLPPTRTEQIVREVERDHPRSYRCDDAQVMQALSASAPQPAANDEVAANHVCMIGFTSGSSAAPKRFPKHWRSVNGSTACNASAIRAALSLAPQAHAWLVATVPPQHMYGMELSILLPLLGEMAVHSARPLFPADIAQALEQVPGPRILVSTPVHLRAIVESPQLFPAVDLIVSATAPLDAALADAVERKLGGELLEMFGSTETCVLAARRTARDSSWQPYAGVSLQRIDDGTLVDAPWFAAPTLLQDVLEVRPGGRFQVRARSSDMVEVAGKRASLADITRRVLAIEGVKDAVVFQPGDESVARIRRLAALVVAPGLSGAQIAAHLASAVDPAFLPRPIRMVEALPRNELGKLPREALLRALRTP
ncbi:AMP-binding protein [Povalibacter sp.]|uniref:AMP-binding protein n=1 Tax=Povalibacter sp. TaxID=1962978 RepID=UPI002F3F6B84